MEFVFGVCGGEGKRRGGIYLKSLRKMGLKPIIHPGTPRLRSKRAKQLDPRCRLLGLAKKRLFTRIASSFLACQQERLSPMARQSSRHERSPTRIHCELVISRSVLHQASVLGSHNRLLAEGTSLAAKGLQGLENRAGDHSNIPQNLS
jgi:hypothetical protein